MSESEHVAQIVQRMDPSARHSSGWISGRTFSGTGKWTDWTENWTYEGMRGAWAWRSREQERSWQGRERFWEPGWADEANAGQVWRLNQAVEGAGTREGKCANWKDTTKKKKTQNNTWKRGSSDRAMTKQACRREISRWMGWRGTLMREINVFYSGHFDLS